MRRIFLLLVALLTCGLGYAQVIECAPVWSGQGHYDFISVGNTNHKLVSFNINEFPGNREDEINNGVIEVINTAKNFIDDLSLIL